ncbi:MAG: hypothetical protein MNPFHGCM_02002 [Gemmatimonadaceae bacterium]|nr:hypothetical protein [Gemmatimonadaceae bacterium]
MKVGSSGPLWNPQYLPDLRMLEPFHIVQDDHGPLSFTKRFQRSGEPAAEFVRFGRIPEGRSDRLRQGVRIPDLLPPSDVQRSVCNDPVKPRRECLIWQESIQRSEGVQEALLNRILRILVGQHDRTRDCICATLVHAHEFREGVGVASLGCDDQSVLAFAFWSINRHASRETAHISMVARDWQGRYCCTHASGG